MRQIHLGDRIITDASKPYVIAEIGVNHEGSMERAKELICLAKKGGADAAKFQTYKAHTLASRHSPAYWDLTAEPMTSQYQLFQKYDAFNRDDYEYLAAYCEEVGIAFLSTPFDDEAIAFLDPLVSYFKIASADITNRPLLRRIGACGKPVVLSTGASTLAEVDEALRTLQRAGCPEVALLHCILNYPTQNENAHLAMISGLRDAYPQHLIGYSDHTLPDAGMTALTTAYLLGARIIEKHFTFDKALPGNDHYHAMDVKDLLCFKARISHIRELCGEQVQKQPVASEAPARAHARRSIVLKQAVEAGVVLTEAMLTCKRPATGISPVHWNEVLGRTTCRPLEEDHVLQWEDTVLERA